jgi:hypothetical protein
MQPRVSGFTGSNSTVDPPMPTADHTPSGNERGARLHACVVSHQLDDLNALGEALATASRDEDPERIGTILATMERFVVAFEWNSESVLPSIFAYVESHADFPEDLFAPAFVLRALAPEHPPTRALLARLPQSVRDLLAGIPRP